MLALVNSADGLSDAVIEQRIACARPPSESVVTGGSNDPTVC